MLVFVSVFRFIYFIFPVVQ